MIQALIDLIMKLLGLKKDEPAALASSTSSSRDSGAGSTGAPDYARFDLSKPDEYFEARFHMDGDGELAGTDASRAELMARYGIRDRGHWRHVSESVESALVQRFGSGDAYMQAMTNHRMGRMQTKMQGNIAAKAASGEMDPVEGIGLEQWAALNAALAQGVSLEDMLRGNGVDLARWKRACAEWEARMARDTTFAIATVYGAAFQNASKGKYAALAQEANAARAANRDLSSAPPMSFEQYFDVMFEQAYAFAAGKDAAQALKSMGLSIVDWCDLSAFMGYHLHRTWAANIGAYQAAMKSAESKAQARYPGVTAQVTVGA